MDRALSACRHCWYAVDTFSLSAACDRLIACPRLLGSYEHSKFVQAASATRMVLPPLAFSTTQVPWQFKQAAAEAAAAAKAAACVAYDPCTQSLTAPLPQEQPAGGGSGHLTCCCTGISGACHLCSNRRYTIQETYGPNGGSCTIRFSPRRQSSAAGTGVAGVAGVAGVVALRTNRAMLATETPLAAAVTTRNRTGGLNPSSSSSWRLQTATSAPQQQMQQAAAQAAEAARAGAPSPCGNCGGKLNTSSCNSFCSGSRGTPPVAVSAAAAAAGSSRWGVRHMSQQDVVQQSNPQTGLHGSGYAGSTYQGGSSLPRSISSGAQLQSHCQQREIVPHPQQQQQQQLVLSLPPGASVELSSMSGCQHCCQQCSPGSCGSNGSSGGGWSPTSSSSSSPSSSLNSPNRGSPCPSPSSSSAGVQGAGALTPTPTPVSEDPLNDVVEGYDSFTGDGVIECVICMAGVRLLPLSERFVTPCGHFFHPECLTSWMEVKAECPQCRGPLPPL
jgi:hypothetical protein